MIFQLYIQDVFAVFAVSCYYMTHPFLLQFVRIQRSLSTSVTDNHETSTGLTQNINKTYYLASEARLCRKTREQKKISTSINIGKLSFAYLNVNRSWKMSLISNSYVCFLNSNCKASKILFLPQALFKCSFPKELEFCV